MNTQKLSIAAIGFGLGAGVLRILQYFLATDSAGYLADTTLSKVLQYALVGLLLAGLGLVCLFGRNRKLPTLTGNDGKWITFPVRQLFLVLAVLAAADGLYAFLDKGITAPELPFYLLGALGWVILALGSLQNNFGGMLSLLHSAACLIAYFWETYRYLHITEYTFGMLGLCAILLMNLQLVRGMSGALVPPERLARNCGFVLVLGFTAFCAPVFRLFLNPQGAGKLSLRVLHGVIYMVIARLILKRLPQIPATSPEEAAAPDLEELDEYISELPPVEDETIGE